MKNKLTDLNNHLFAQIERLGDEDLKGENLNEEVSRAKAITEISSQIISNATLVLKAQMANNEMGYKLALPTMLEYGKEEIADDPKPQIYKSSNKIS